MKSEVGAYNRYCSICERKSNVLGCVSCEVFGASSVEIGISRARAVVDISN